MTLHKFFDYLAGFLILFLVMVIAFLVYVKDRKEIAISTPEENNSVDTISKQDTDTVLSISGNSQDLVYFSIYPNSKVPKQTVPYQGSVKGGYFFEGNILVNIVDLDKNNLRTNHANATTDWMTVNPVSFEGVLDFSGLPSGPAYIEIHNDNASGEPENDKMIYIPIIISE